MRAQILVPAGLALILSVAAAAQRPDNAVASRDEPAIAYAMAPVHDRIAGLNQQIRHGRVTLGFDPANGYLASALDALKVPLESQLAVFSQTSAQAGLISAENPRAIYFADDLAVAWVRGGRVLEAAAHDPRQGVVFYTLDQAPAATPQFTRQTGCLSCHRSRDTSGVPGFLVRSTFQVAERGSGYAPGAAIDHRSPFNQRWGGWFVTGLSRGWRHKGNRVGQGWLESLHDQFEPTGYPGRHSDVIALMVLEHQAHGMNLLTRVAQETRFTGGITPSAARAVDELVDYFLFVDEARLPSLVIGTSRYAEHFSAIGPRDRKGRSLRDFDLRTRLMRYSCSYLIYSDAFDALPPSAKDTIYIEMWRILSGYNTDPRYDGLSLDDRQAIVEILLDTKPGLPVYFQP